MAKRTKLKSWITTERRLELESIHPGDVLKHDFLEPLGLSAYRLSRETGIPEARLSLILRRKRSVTADTALRLARYFGTSPDVWLGLQKAFDLEEAMRAHRDEYRAIRPRAANA